MLVRDGGGSCNDVTMFKIVTSFSSETLTSNPGISASMRTLAHKNGTRKQETNSYTHNLVPRFSLSRARNTATLRVMRREPGNEANVYMTAPVLKAGHLGVPSYIHVCLFVWAMVGWVLCTCISMDESTMRYSIYGLTWVGRRLS